MPGHHRWQCLLIIKEYVEMLSNTCIFYKPNFDKKRHLKEINIKKKEIHRAQWVKALQKIGANSEERFNLHSDLISFQYGETADIDGTGLSK